MASITIKTVKTVEVKTLVVSAGVRYWEDTEVNGVEDKDGTLIPCRIDAYWCPKIDIAKGVITNWEAGKTAHVHYKVCDDGVYQLLNDSGDLVKGINSYVPKIMCPEENGYGDYIIMKIDANGKIANWKIDLSDFEEFKEE